MRRYKVKGHSNLERDMKTNAIIDTDQIAFNKYINDRNSRLKQFNEIENLKNEIELLKSLIKNIQNGN
jgi:hypothetical protein